MFIEDFEEEFIDKSHILGGTAGFHLINSKIMDGDDKIELTVEYAVKNPFDITGKQIFKLKQKAVSHAWIGRNPGQGYNGTNSKEEMVYITQNGSVYHKQMSCTYLIVSIKAVNLLEIDQYRNENGGKYYMCELCKKTLRKSMLKGNVYITEYGDRYHTDINCMRIRRNILTVPITKVSDRRPCSKCSKE